MNIPDELYAAELVSASDKNITIPLKSVHISGLVDDVMTTFTIRQTYSNDGTTPIEALYTFPLPMRAVLLGMEAEFGTRKLKGTVLPAPKAEKDYNEAIEDGNAAILLKEVDDGLYHASFGNLKPGETAIIEYRYAMQHTWNDRFLRVHLPTTIAPRYGNPGRAGLSDAETPVYAKTNFPQWSFKVAVSGLLSKCAITCPSHPFTTKAIEEGIEISFVTPPDRDIVLNFENATRPASIALCDRDKDGWIVAADFMPNFRDTEQKACNLDIVVDCSGSMMGLSIQQAREGVQLILDSLNQEDCFNITAFGSSHRSLFKERLPADSKNKAAAKKFVNSLGGNMGGTEAAAALSHVYQLAGGSGPRTILFITDGEIWSADKLYNKAKASGCRIMTVGVGSAVSEKTVQKLAEVTGGKCEMLSPNEDMARRIHRHCMRIARPMLDNVEIIANGADKIFPANAPGIYDGDTVHIYAHYTGKPKGEITLKATLENENFVWTCHIPETAGTVVASPSPSDLARMAMASQLRDIPAKDTAVGESLALDYQLLSRWTSCLLVDVRSDGEKADVLPTTVKVPQMMAHGWGGKGGNLSSVSHSLFGYTSSIGGCFGSALTRFNPCDRVIAQDEVDCLAKGILDDWDDDFEIPSYVTKQTDEGSPSTDDEIAKQWAEALDADERAHSVNNNNVDEGELLSFIRAYSENCGDTYGTRKPMSTLDDLVALGLPESFATQLRQLVSDDLPEETLVAVLMAFWANKYPSKFINDTARRWVARGKDRVRIRKGLRDKVHCQISLCFAKAS